MLGLIFFINLTYPVYSSIHLFFSPLNLYAHSLLLLLASERAGVDTWAADVAAAFGAAVGAAMTFWVVEAAGAVVEAATAAGAVVEAAAVVVEGVADGAAVVEAAADVVEASANAGADVVAVCVAVDIQKGETLTSKLHLHWHLNCIRSV